MTAGRPGQPPARTVAPADRAHFERVAWQPFAGVSLWRMDADAPWPGDTAPPQYWLSEAEQTRASRWVYAQDRCRWERIRAAMRLRLAKSWALPPEALAFETGPSGKPSVRHPHAQHFNLAHCGALAWLAISPHGPVGIDVEALLPPERARLDLAQTILSARELQIWQALPETQQANALTQWWTLKEAVLKERGWGLTHDPRTIELGGSDALPHVSRGVWLHSGRLEPSQAEASAAAWRGTQGSQGAGGAAEGQDQAKLRPLSKGDAPAIYWVSALYNPDGWVSVAMAAPGAAFADN